MKEEILEALQWRYATKKYDGGAKISTDDLATLEESVRMSVSSMGLQPYRVLVVTDPKIRQQLKAAAFNQDGITEASHLFVFAVEKAPAELQIDEYLDNISTTRSITLESLDGFKQMMHKFVGGLGEKRISWAEKQCYIALANLIYCASLLKIDATPMEGFDTAAFDRILGLEEMGLQTAVIATVGYRHPEDNMQHQKKVRKPKEKLFIHL